MKLSLQEEPDQSHAAPMWKLDKVNETGGQEAREGTGIESKDIGSLRLVVKENWLRTKGYLCVCAYMSTRPREC